MKAPAMPKISMPKVDFAAITNEFKTLDPKDPGLWPVLPRAAVLVALLLVLLLVGWWFGWNGQLEELKNKEGEETKFKEEWLNKKKQAVNLEEHKKQLAEIDRSFGALLKQLPNKAEMESLLIEINQAGLGRGLQFDLFKPGAEVTKDFYAEMPITIKLTGGYHDLGAFAGDVAKMSRIVTLNDIEIAVSKEGILGMSTVAKTFRYLDEEEVARQKKEKAAKGKPGGAK
ncbi:MAG TPA: type 4a pilus biogenesis protein PilO [Rhodocyclaceae bacterium]|nr:type 4a pilus biogenesis protein PilO [Rhodocyclaceae bacterium]